MSSGDVRDETPSRSAPSGAAIGGSNTPPPAGASRAVAGVNEFLDRLVRSRLIPSRQLDALRGRALADERLSAREFAQSLVESGHLTRWQAERLLAGKAGFQLGKYKLVDRIGAGGMAVVLKAQQSGLSRTVAIKILARTLLKRDDAMKRFFREIQAAAALEHPNIVRALDSDCVDGVPFLVMEFVEGRDLHSLVGQKGPLSIAWASEFARQTAIGLQHAHERDVVHRDVKPANLLVTRRSPTEPLTVKILDFGLAKFASDTPDTGSITAAHQIFGTVDFISPEQARSARSADIRSDIYSLGCTLFYLLTGRPPFPGETAMEKLTSRIADTPIPIRDLRADVPPGLEAVLRKMLSREPNDRYQSPAEVADALAPFAATTAAFWMADGASSESAGMSSALAAPRTAGSADNVESGGQPSETRRAGDPLTASPSSPTAKATHESELALDRFLVHLAKHQAEQPLSGESIPAYRRPHGPRQSTLIAFVVIGLLFFLGILLLSTPRNVKSNASEQGDPSEDARRDDVDAVDPARQKRGLDEPTPPGGSNGSTSHAATWPGEPDGLFVAWHAGLGKRLTGHTFASVWALELMEDVGFGDDGALRFQDGTVSVHGPESVLDSECARTGEFTLELGFTPPDAKSKQPMRIVTLGAVRRQAVFVLKQEKNVLRARLHTQLTDQERSVPEFEVCRVTPNRHRHLLISYRAGEVACYLDGEKVSERDDVRGDLSSWADARLTLGDDARGRAWTGTIDRLALFSRFLSLDEARARYRLSQRVAVPSQPE